jgi:hypothetical protein
VAGWVPGVSGQFGYRVQVAGHFNLALNLRLSGDKRPLSLYDLMACTGTASRFSPFTSYFLFIKFSISLLSLLFSYIALFCSSSSLYFPYVIFLIRFIIFPFSSSTFFFCLFFFYSFRCVE